MMRCDRRNNDDGGACAFQHLMVPKTDGGQAQKLTKGLAVLEFQKPVLTSSNGEARWAQVKERARSGEGKPLLGDPRRDEQNLSPFLFE